MSFFNNKPKRDTIRTAFDCLDANKLVTSILSTFENFLDTYDISIPSDERTGDKTEARIFGVPYYDLEDEICDVVNYYVDYNNVENIEALSSEINYTLKKLSEAFVSSKLEFYEGNTDIDDLHIEYIRKTISQVNSWTAELTEFMDSLTAALATDTNKEENTEGV